MKIALLVVAAMAALYGLYGIAGGILAPDAFDLSNASAPQIAQVYSEAAFKVATGVAGLSITAVCLLAALMLPTEPRMMQVFCPQCHALNPVVNYYCGNCGQQLIYLPDEEEEEEE